jgi:hypothetical protein
VQCRGGASSRREPRVRRAASGIGRRAKLAVKFVKPWVGLLSGVAVRTDVRAGSYESCMGITPQRRYQFRIEIGGGATGTIRPSTSPRMPTRGFEVRVTSGSARPRTSIKGCPVFESRSRHAGLCCPVHGRPPALLSRLLSKPPPCRRYHGLVLRQERAANSRLHDQLRGPRCGGRDHLRVLRDGGSLRSFGEPRWLLAGRDVRRLFHRVVEASSSD